MSGDSLNPDAAAVTAVIVAFNGGDVLLETVASLEQHPPEPGIDVVVVDNGSRDDSLGRLAARFPGVKVIANERNRGLAAGNNQGIDASATPFVLISNPDVVYRSGAIDALLDLMQRRPRAAFAIARLLNSDLSVQTSAGDLPTLAEALLGRRLSWRRGARTSRSGVWWHDWNHSDERTVGHGAEACYLVRRAAIEEFGPQDEGFVLDWEGLDWSRRAYQAGWEIWFCPAAEVVHLGGTSVGQVPVRWVVSTHRGMYRYFASRTPRWLRPVLAATVGARAVLKLALLRLHPALYRSAQRARA